MKHTDYPILFFDFDGVILDSLPVREHGFREIFSAFTDQEIEALLTFHRKNGGWSRYVKIRHFFETIREEPVTEDQILEYAEDYSVIMRKALTDKKNLIQDAVQYLALQKGSQCFFVVSGSDQEELRYLCKELGIKHYFEEITGSPTPKIENVEMLIRNHQLDITDVALIGDSYNDYEAAHENNIAFFGYNNELLKGVGGGYIGNLSNTIDA
jgi:HAD superfamily hydrolase (TIGR01549 family)